MLQAGPALITHTAVVPRCAPPVLSRKSTNPGAFSQWGQNPTSTGSMYHLWEAYSKRVLYFLRKILLGFKLGPKAPTCQAQQILKSHLPPGSKHYVSPLPTRILAAAAAVTVKIPTNANTG